ncbi:MAG: HAD-IB family hydrolase [Actinobacteria bacterium]|nr:HAD-IB family hydrolase [Actinomycetota bacterium]
MTVVAAFDFDGTLSTHDCVRPFLERLGGRRALAAAAARRPGATALATVRRDRDAAKEVFVGGVYRGRRVETVAAAGCAFANEIAERLLRDDTVQRLRWHQRMQHRTVVVSASLASYLVPLAARLGIDDVLCTDVATDHRTGGAVYLDRLLGPNCRAGEKAVRLRRWLQGEGIDDAEIWAYGDSRGDRELLAMAQHPVWVRGVVLDAVPREAAP